MIKKIYIKNFGCLEKIEEENINSLFLTLNGKNGAGKSTFLEAIVGALGGKKITNDRITNGKLDSLVSVDFDYKQKNYTGSFTLSKDKKTAQFTIMNSEGGYEEVSEFGYNKFDAFEFFDKSNAEKIKMLSSIFAGENELPFLLEELKKIKSEITHTKRKKKEKESFVGELSSEMSGLSPTEADAVKKEWEDLNSKKSALNLLEEKSKSIFDKKNLLSEAKISKENELLDIENQIKVLQEKQASLLKNLESDKKDIANLDTELKDIESKIIPIDRIRYQDLKNKIKILDVNEENLKKIEDAESVAKEFSNELEKLEFEKGEKNETIAAVLNSMDIELEINDDGELVAASGFPLKKESFSDAEKLEFQLKIEKKINDGFNLIFIKNFSLFDKDRRKKIFDWAVQNKMQVFAELVGDSDLKIVNEIEAGEEFQI